MSSNLADEQIGKLRRRYKPLRGKDAAADVIAALIRKLVTEIALEVPYGNWNDRLIHPLRKFSITKEEWEDSG